MLFINIFPKFKSNFINIKIIIFRDYEENLVGINIAVFVMLIKQGRLDPNKPITIFELINNRIVSDPKEGIKILGRVK